MSGYRLWVNEDSTVLVRHWEKGAFQDRPDEDVVEVATRDDSSATWGPPIRMTEEKV